MKDLRENVLPKIGSSLVTFQIEELGEKNRIELGWTDVIDRKCFF
jgi:hypothetical protein